MIYRPHHTAIEPPDPPEQRPEPILVNVEELLEADRLIRATPARTRFLVSGAGLTAAVLDTGINAAHVDFDSGQRVVARVNFTTETDGDENGHGTNVAGIVAAGADHVGIAPGANIAALKVLGRQNGSFVPVEAALAWVLANAEAHKITVVSMSLGNRNNYQNDTQFMHEAIRERFRQLRERRIAVVVSSGNEYFSNGSRPGMAFPAILRECISVGAVYDDDVGARQYRNGAAAFATAVDRLTPFSQRLHETVNGECFTSVFAPGAPMRSTGIDGAHGESVQEGTSQAAPTVTGTVLLLQELHLRLTQRLPPVADLIQILRASSVEIFDGDDENDNVQHTQRRFKRIDVLSALETMARRIEQAAAQPSSTATVTS